MPKGNIFLWIITTMALVISVISLVTVNSVLKKSRQSITTREVRIVDGSGRVLMSLGEDNGTTAIIMYDEKEPQVRTVDISPGRLELTYFTRDEQGENHYRISTIDSTVPMLSFMNDPLQGHIALIEDNFWLRYTTDVGQGGWMVDKSLTQ